MKQFKRLVAVAIVVAVALQATALPALAEPPGTGWWTFFQIQNVTDQDISLLMNAYVREGGSAADDRSGGPFTVEPGAAVAFHPGLDPTYPTGDRIGFDPPLPASFEGSTVLSANGAAAAIAQVGNNPSGTSGVSGGTATAFYPGIGNAAAATTVNFPTVKNNFNGQTTSFYVQAASGDADVTITYNMNDGTTHTQQQTISANRSFLFDPDNASPPVADTNCGSAETSPCLGAAVVESTSGTIVGIVMEYPDQGSPAPFVLSTKGLTASDQDTTLYAPTIKNQFNGGTTGFSVQNVGTQPTTVNIKLTVTNVSGSTPDSEIGKVYNDSETVGPGEATVFSRFRDNLGGMPAGTYAAAEVTATEPLAGTVNENKEQSGTPGGEAKASYAAFALSAATDIVVAPLVKELFNGNTTGVTVVNAGTQATTIQATYTDAGGNVRTFQTAAPVEPGAAIPFFFVYQNLNNRFTGLSDWGVLEDTKNAATYQSNNGQPLIALAQESDRADAELDIKNYEGFNQ